MSMVVFCEEDPMIQKLIRAALRAEDHELHLASSGDEGLELIRRELPDVVFTDVSMPGMDGFQLASHLKADPRTAHIPIVFMTASIQREQRDEAERLGAVAVLSKPFSMADLRARLAALTGGGH